MWKPLGPALLALAAAASPALGQLVVGNSTTGGASNSFEVDTTTGEATPLWPASSSVNGLAVDNVAKRVYFSVLFSLHAWDFYAANEVNLGIMNNVGGVGCLTLAEGRLYGYSKGQTTGGNFEGFVLIDTQSAATTPLLALGNEWNFDGLAFDPLRRLFYSVTTTTAQHAAGLYSLDLLGTGAITLLAPMTNPAGARGLACGEDKLWYIASNDPLIRCFDLSAGAWSPLTLPSPFPVGAAGVGADWGGRLHVPTKYCSGKVNSLGCLPAISYTGHSSAGAASGFSVRAQGLRNQRACLLLYGVQGRAATPFQGGTLCLAGNVRRGPTTHTQGSPPPTADCSGAPSVDLNAFAAGAGGGQPIPALSLPGTEVVCQWWARDDAGPFATSLSNALEYTVDV